MTDQHPIPVSVVTVAPGGVIAESYCKEKHNWIFSNTTPVGHTLFECLTHSGLNKHKRHKIGELVAIKGLGFFTKSGKCFDDCTSKKDAALAAKAAKAKSPDSWSDSDSDSGDNWEALNDEEEAKEEKEKVEKAKEEEAKEEEEEVNDDGDSDVLIENFVEPTKEQKRIYDGAWVPQSTFGDNFSSPNTESTAMKLYDSNIAETENMSIVKGEIIALRARKKMLIGKLERIKREPISNMHAKKVSACSDTISILTKDSQDRKVDPLTYQPLILAKKSLAIALKKQAEWAKYGDSKKVYKELSLVICEEQSNLSSFNTYQSKTKKILVEDLVGSMFNAYISTKNPTKQMMWKIKLDEFIDQCPYNKWMDIYQGYLIRRKRIIIANKSAKSGNNATRITKHSVFSIKSGTSKHVKGGIKTNAFSSGSGITGGSGGGGAAEVTKPTQTRERYEPSRRSHNPKPTRSLFGGEGRSIIPRSRNVGGAALPAGPRQQQRITVNPARVGLSSKKVIKKVDSSDDDDW
jgi:hypothetical protein